MDETSETIVPVTWSAATRKRAMRPKKAPTIISASSISASSAGVAGRPGSLPATTGVTTRLTASAIRRRMRGDT